jgi:hypothetical protein
MKGFFVVAALAMVPLAIASIASSQFSSVRPSALKGSWYPANSEELERQVDGFLRKVPQSVEGQGIVGMISPHAGYIYSGEAAAWGYKNLHGISFRRVIILAPSHYIAFEGLSIPQVAFYETPLGRVTVDEASCESLLKKPLFHSIRAAHQREHAIEIQLPFLQRTLKDFNLVPLVVGTLKADEYERVSNELQGLLGPDSLLIASSDFTHFGPRFQYVPFTHDLRENISRLDQGAIDLILKRDWAGFLDYRERTHATICGFRAIALLLKTLPPDVHGRLLRYCLSGDMTGDYTNSVSYASIIFTRDTSG